MQSDDDEIKQMIIDVLQLEDVTPADIDADAPLFVDGLGLDSIDGVAIHKRYGVTLAADSDDTRRHFASVRALGRMISSNRKK